MNDRGFFVPKREDLAAFSPTTVTIETKLERDTSGTGFRLQTKWRFVGASPKYWSVAFYTDDNAGSEAEFEEARSDLAPGVVQYQSPVLSGNRSYRFKLIASARNDAKNEDGEIIYKSVTVNLKGIE